MIYFIMEKKKSMENNCFGGIMKTKISSFFIFFILGITVMADISKIDKEFLMGKVSPVKSGYFVKLNSKNCVGGKEIFVLKEVEEPLLKMINAAEKDGISLKVISGLRTFNHQKSIWEKKWNSYSINGKTDIDIANEILKFSSMPGSSRHHWGTDFDINSLEDSYFASGKGKEEYVWLINNAAKYGFVQVYKKENGKGYSEEKWHWSYLEIAEEFLKKYNDNVKIEDFQGFLGSETAKNVDIINVYVNTISRK